MADALKMSSLLADHLLLILSLGVLLLTAQLGDVLIKALHSQARSPAVAPHALDDSLHRN